MPIAGHLAELRRRLFRSAAALLAGAVAGWFLAEPVLDALRVPIEQIADTQHRMAELNYDTITGAFDLRMQVAITVGVIVSSPVWLFQIWAFLVPALSRRERLYGFGFFFTAVPLFLIGCAAGWFVLPHMVGVLTGFAPEQDAAIVQAKTYFDFVLKLVVAVGIAFVLPVAVVLLNFVGDRPLHGHRDARRGRALDVRARRADGRALLRGGRCRRPARSARRPARGRPARRLPRGAAAPLIRSRRTDTPSTPPGHTVVHHWKEGTSCHHAPPPEGSPVGDRGRPSPPA